MRIKRSIKFFFRGLFYSFILISFVLIPLLFTPWSNWKGDLSLGIVLNGIALLVGVGFAEELIFRGWLLTEMNFLFNPRLAMLIQALIFSIVHVHFNLGFLEIIGLLIGLFLLVIYLSIRRYLDDCYLWG